MNNSPSAATRDTVRGEWTVLESGGGRLDVYLARPASGSGPRLVFLHAGAASDAGVLNLCHRFVEEGYEACVPSIDAAATGVAKIEAAAHSDAMALLARAAVLGLEEGRARFAVIGFGAACADAALLAQSAQCGALICFDPAESEDFSALAAGLSIPMAVHRAGAGPQPVNPPQGTPLAYRYPACRPGFALQGSVQFDPFQAGMAYSRTLEVLKREFGPRPDLAGLFREHLRQEFEACDADATMLTMVAEPYVNHIPTMTGGTGHDQLKRFYKYHFIPTTPKDRKTTIINEIVGADAVVIEAINSFTHDEPYDHYLPGVPPTGKRVTVPIVAIAKFRGDKLFWEHIYWDQASVLVQVGLLDPANLPVSGGEQAEKVLDPTRPSNELMKRWTESEGKPL